MTYKLFTSLLRSVYEQSVLMLSIKRFSRLGDCFVFSGKGQKCRASLGVIAGIFPTALCCAPKDNRKLKQLQLRGLHALSHEGMIRQATAMSVDAASQLITQTVTAFIEVSTIYRNSIEDLMDVLEDSVALELVDKTDVVYQEQWEKEVIARNRVNVLKTSLLELESFLEYTSKLGTAAAEAAFLAGAEYASTAMCERINSGDKAVGMERDKNKKLETDLLHLQQTIMTSAAKPSEANMIKKSRHKNNPTIDK